ncbi:MAG: glycogen synthase [Desulfobulbaceae bacterium]|nr:glycogen synthase [Desulfobulbaceae bacterium]
MPPRQIRKILILTREYDGLAGAGGVKDFTAQLAEALVRKGNRQVTVMLPYYGFMMPEQLGFVASDLVLEVAMNYVGQERRETVRFWEATRDGVRLVLVAAERYAEKSGVYTYTAAEAALNPGHRQGQAHYDYFAMNLLLQKAAIARLIRLNEHPEIIHCQDGHTAILPALLREVEGYRHYFQATGCLVTIHNAGLGYHQEVGDLAFAERLTGLPSRVILANQLHGQFDPFLAAAPYSVLNTVSENYARELQETDDDELTGGLGHLLASRGMVLEGVTNGINPGHYDPSHPEKLGLAAAFAPEHGNWGGKAKCRAALVAELAAGNLAGALQTGHLDPHPSQPLLTFIGRFSEQKGVDKLIGALETLLPLDKKFQVLILGSGGPEIEGELVRLAEHKEYRGRLCLLRGYHEQLAMRVYAAGDFFVIPSRYEPCGLTDFIAQLFGNLPVVHHIGGLVKVVDGVTGLAYREHNSAALLGALLKALELYRTEPERLRQMREAAVAEIRQHYTWDIVVERYLGLYRRALAMAEKG